MARPKISRLQTVTGRVRIHRKTLNKNRQELGFSFKFRLCFTILMVISSKWFFLADVATSTLPGVTAATGARRRNRLKVAAKAAKRSWASRLARTPQRRARVNVCFDVNYTPNPKPPWYGSTSALD